jgi:hypothetical protein
MQLPNNIPNRRFSAVIIKALQWSLLRARLIQSILPGLISIRYYFGDAFISHFLTKAVYAFPYTPLQSHLLDLFILILYGEMYKL